MAPFRCDLDGNEYVGTCSDLGLRVATSSSGWCRLSLVNALCVVERRRWMSA